MSEQRMEVLKLQLQDEVEEPFREKLHEAQREVSKLNACKWSTLSFFLLDFRSVTGKKKEKEKCLIF